MQFNSLITAIAKHNDTSGGKYHFLQEDNQYTDTLASVHCYDKAGVDYVASLPCARFIETFLTGKKWKEQSNGETIAMNARVYAKAIRTHAKKIQQNNYQLTIKYKNSKGCKTGRLFDDGMGTQILNKELRSYFLPASYRDYDMVNAHPTILLWLCKELKLSCERLEEYVSDRASTLEKAQKSKQEILTLINCDKHRKSNNTWVQAFCDELVRNKEQIVSIVANDYNSTEGSKHPLSSKMNKLLCDIENRCLCAGMQHALDNNTDDKVVQMFDGFMVQKELATEDIEAMNDATELIGIRWAEKPWTKGVVPESYEKSKQRTYEAMKAEFEKKHFIVSEPELSFWALTTNGARPISRVACCDASRKYWYEGGEGKKVKLFDPWIEDEDALTYRRVVYVPHAKHLPPRGLEAGDFNTATPFTFDYIPAEERNPNALEMFKRLLTELSEDTDGLEYMLSYFAHLLQDPTFRTEIMLLFKSHGGTGKDTLTKTLTRILGRDHCATVDDMEKLFGQFNSILANKLFVTMNEVDGKQGSKYIEKLKNSLTADEIPITYKGKDSYFQTNIYRAMVYSNNSNPIPVESATARRGLMNQVRADRQLPRDFFQEYYTGLKDAHWVNSLASDLCDYDLTDFDVRRPPETASMQSKIQAKIQPLHKFIQDLCEGKHAEDVYTTVPKKAGCIGIEVSTFNRIYKERLTETYPSGWEPFMTDKKYINNVFGNYNDIIYPRIRKSVNGQQKQIHAIHTERMIAGLKNRREYTTPVLDDSSDDEDEEATE
jgi:hypothetical protein